MITIGLTVKYDLVGIQFVSIRWFTYCFLDADVSGTSIINCASPVVKASRPKRAETKLDTAQGKENIVPLKGKDSRVESQCLFSVSLVRY